MDEALTPRQRQQVDLGWEVMKYMRVPRLFLWLAEDGWEGGNEFNAEVVGENAVAVRIKVWDTLSLKSATTLN